MSTGEKVVSRVCPQCGRVLEETWQSCPYCSKNLPRAAMKGMSGRTLANISIISGVTSFILFGLPFGILAILCGTLAVNKEARLGIAGIVLGLIGVVLIMFGYLLGL